MNKKEQQLRVDKTLNWFEEAVDVLDAAQFSEDMLVMFNEIRPLLESAPGLLDNLRELVDRQNGAPLFDERHKNAWQRTYDSSLALCMRLEEKLGA